MTGGCFSAKCTVGRGGGDCEETELGGEGDSFDVGGGEEEAVYEEEEDVDELLEELESCDEVRLSG